MRDGQENSDASKLNLHSGHTKSGRHHRVVRINPSEAVVLNSADRVPYLLHVEVLVNDLDFDTERRQNRESLKKLVMIEDMRRRKTAASRVLTGSGQLLRGSKSDVDMVETLESSEASREEQSARDFAGLSINPPSLSPTTIVPSHHANPAITPPMKESEDRAPPAAPMELPEGEEEIDLTEQAYGTMIRSH